VRRTHTYLRTNAHLLLCTTRTRWDACKRLRLYRAKVAPALVHIYVKRTHAHTAAWQRDGCSSVIAKRWVPSDACAVVSVALSVRTVAGDQLNSQIQI